MEEVRMLAPRAQEANVFVRKCKQFENLYGMKPDAVWLGEGSENVAGIAERMGMRALPGDGRNGRPLVRRAHYMIQAGSNN